MAQVWSCEFCKILKNKYFVKNLQTTATEYWKSLVSINSNDQISRKFSKILRSSRSQRSTKFIRNLQAIRYFNLSQVLSFWLLQINSEQLPCGTTASLFHCPDICIRAILDAVLKQGVLRMFQHGLVWLGGAPLF